MSKAKAEEKMMRLTLKRSPIGHLPKRKATLQGLGLKRMHQTVVRQDTPENRGMVKKVIDMLHVEEV
jgi:large subunit ribosomal protein L30